MSVSYITQKLSMLNNNIIIILANCCISGQLTLGNIIHFYMHGHAEQHELRKKLHFFAIVNAIILLSCVVLTTTIIYIYTLFELIVILSQHALQPSSLTLDILCDINLGYIVTCT